VILVALLALVAAACSNASDDSEAGGDDDGTTEGTADDGGPLTYQDVLELPIDESVPVTAPGVDDATIRVGGVASTTNPIGGPYGEAFEGVQAYFDYINDGGGIYGRQLELAAQEDDNTGFENREDVQSLLSQDLFAVLPIATLDFSGADLLADANMPSFGWNINEEYNGPPNIFGERGFLCFTCPSPGLPWLAQEVGATSIGVLAYDVPQSADCAEGIQNSFDTYPTAEIGFFDNGLQYGIPDLSAQVNRMKDAGVDLVTTCMDFNGVTTLQQEMNSQGLDAVQYLPNGYDYNFLEQNGDLFDGAYVLTNFVPFEVPDDEKPEGLQL
jgi:ABC-type branched-subunit amino acid transport system substrate-binding protein